MIGCPLLSESQLERTFTLPGGRAVAKLCVRSHKHPPAIPMQTAASVMAFLFFVVTAAFIHNHSANLFLNPYATYYLKGVTAAAVELELPCNYSHCIESNNSSMCRFQPPLLIALFSLTAMPALAAPPHAAKARTRVLPVTRLEATPSSIKLVGPKALQHLLITAVGPDGSRRDVTSTAHFAVPPALRAATVNA